MHTANEGMSMAGKGSRQRTYGSAFESNYDKIFRKEYDAAGSEMGTEWVAPEQSQGIPKGSDKTLRQYPQEAREDAQKRSQRPSWDVES